MRCTTLNDTLAEQSVGPASRSQPHCSLENGFDSRLKKMLDFFGENLQIPCVH
jgi:hypothetical protein